MREVYLLNKGESVEKVKKEYNLESVKNLGHQVLLDGECIEIKGGSEDITIIRNYLPYIEYRIKKDEKVLDLMARGFEVNINNEINEGDLMILRKPRSIRHLVKPLEKIEDIASKYGVSIQYIMEVNSLPTSKLFIGQILWL